MGSPWGWKEEKYLQTWILLARRQEVLGMGGIVVVELDQSPECEGTEKERDERMG